MDPGHQALYGTYLPFTLRRMAMVPGHHANFCGSSIPFTLERVAMDPGGRLNLCGSSIPFTLDRMVMDPRLQATFRGSIPFTLEGMVMDPGLQASVGGSSIPLSPDKIPYPGLRSDRVHRPKPRPKLLSLFPTKPSFKPLARKPSVRSSSGRFIQQGNAQHSRAAVATTGASELESLDGSTPLAPSAMALERVPQNTDVQIPSPCIPPVDSVYNQSSTIPSVDPCKLAAAASQGQCLTREGQLVNFNPGSSSQFNGTSKTSMLSLGGSASATKAIPFQLTCTQTGHTIEGPEGALTCPLAARITEEQLLALTCPMAGHPTNGHTVQNTRPSARHGPRPRSSIFRGVTHYKRTGRWEAHIWNKGKQIYLGASATAEKAARAYDRAAIHFRKLNVELNYCLKSYARELRRLVNISEAELVTMLRKQSAGPGTEFPVYPPGAEFRRPKKPHHGKSKLPKRQ